MKTESKQTIPVLFFVICLGIRITGPVISWSFFQDSPEKHDEVIGHSSSASLVPLLESTSKFINKEVERIRQEQKKAIMKMSELFQDGRSQTQSQLEIKWVEILRKHWDADAEKIPEFILSFRAAIAKHGEAHGDSVHLKVFISALHNLMNILHSEPEARLRTAEIGWETGRGGRDSRFRMTMALSSPISGVAHFIHNICAELKYCRLTVQEISVKQLQKRSEEAGRIKITMELEWPLRAINPIATNEL